MAIAVARFARQQVKRRSAVAPRERHVIEAGHGDHLERYAAHWFERGHRDATAEKARAEAVVGEFLFQPVAHHAERDERGVPGLHGRARQSLHDDTHGVQPLAFVGRCGLHHPVEKCSERGRPIGERPGFPPRVQRDRERIDPLRQRRHGRGISHRIAGVREYAQHRFRRRPGHLPQQQSIESGAPGGHVGDRQRQAVERGVVVAPAYVGSARDPRQILDLPGVEASRAVDRRLLQHAEHFGMREASPLERHEPQHGSSHRFVATSAIGHGKWQVDRSVVGAEHRLHEGRPVADVWHEHEHVMRPKRAIGHEGFADLIANDLEFAQLPMRRVHAERRIVDRERERARSLGITIVGTRQFLLQPHEQCVGAAD